MDLNSSDSDLSQSSSGYRQQRISTRPKISGKQSRESLREENRRLHEKLLQKKKMDDEEIYMYEKYESQALSGAIIPERLDRNP